MQLVVSALVPTWGYFGAVMMADTPTTALQPLPVALLVLFSQTIGFQGILTMYWVPLIIKQPNWTFTRSSFRVGAAKAMLWTAALQILVASVILAINVNNEWWYQRTQIVFQVSERQLPKGHDLCTVASDVVPKFYPLMTPAVYLAFRIFGSDKRSRQQFEMSRAFERLGLLSLAFWWYVI